ncbi:hypothetical protein C0993_007752 [Termitomyces sp. T159_Od127]|nr:hypothetical protein C0993_007752 [Termitomyces sp. T159_Od127]
MTDSAEVVRRVRFGDGEPVEEHIELHANTIAYFEMASTGMRITNILSYNEDGELVLTFSFANGLPVAIEGQTAQEMNATMGKAVEHSIERIRELAVEGVL